MADEKPKGRTLFEILSGRNKRDLRPLELQYHNPLDAKVGCTVVVSHDAATSGINFVIDRMSVYETKLGEKKFYHTDYHLKGVTLDRDRPLRVRLRLVPDEDAKNELGCKIYLLHLYDEMEGDQGFIDGVLGNGTGVFDVNQDDDGNPLDVARRYWRVDNVLDPYNARVTVLCDKDGNGKVEEKELERLDFTYWDYHRETEDENSVRFVEYLTVEMNDKTRYTWLYRGREIGAFQVSVF